MKVRRTGKVRGVSSDWLTPTLVVCRRRRMKACAAEYSSWSSPCSSAPSSCHTWRDRPNRASGGEGRSWGNERTGLGNCSSSWTERRAKSQWWRYESCLKILAPPKNLTPHFCLSSICVSLLSQYVTQTVEVESPATLKHLSKARQRSELLSEKLANQNERCKQLEEQIRKSDEHSCNLQHKVTESTINPSEWN